MIIKLKCYVITSAVGLFLLIVSLVLALAVIPLIIEHVLKKNIVLEEYGDAWDRFVELPLPVNFKVYFFKVDNVEDVLNNSPPRLTEVGPYIYKQRRYKINITREEEYVSYYQNQEYTFNREATDVSLNEDDEIITVNALLLGLYQILENVKVPFPFPLEPVLPYIFDETEFFYSVKVKDILFDGVEFCDPDRTSTNLQAKLVCLLVMFMNLKIVDYRDDLSMSYSVFGFKNHHHDGLYKINSGSKDINDVGLIDTWNGLKYTNYWKGNHTECDKVEGRDSTIYPPFIKEGTSFAVYSPDICRGASLQFDKVSKYRDVETYHYEMSPNIFKPKEDTSPQDSCFCIQKTRGIYGEPYCYLDGLIDVQSCLGIPALISSPHFLYADKPYINLVEGLNPSVEKHGSDMQLHPLTGFPTYGVKRMQMNFVLRPVKYENVTVPASKDLHRSVLPIIWLEEGLELNDEYYGILISALNMLTAAEICKWVFVGISAAIFVIPGIIFVIKKHAIAKEIA